MNITKKKLTLEFEVLDIESIHGLVMEFVDMLQNENIEGELSKTDGDKVSWSLSVSQPVEI